MAKTTRKPSYNISQITTLRRQIADEVFFEFLGDELDGPGLRRLLRLLQRRRLPRVTTEVLEDSLRHLLGQRLTTQLVHETAWRLAGNYQRLQRGVPAPPWTAQQAPEWVPVHLTSMQLVDAPGKDRKVSYTMAILAGSPAPRTISKIWAYKFCYMLGRRMGYTSRRGTRPMLDVAELVNLRLLVQLDPAFCRDGRPGFDLVHCGGGLLQWNKRVIGRRFRLIDGKPWPCPQGFRWRCYQCHVGFDQCMAGTHERTLPVASLAGIQSDPPIPSPS